MPPQPLIDLAQIDLNKVIATQDDIYKINPHRYEFMLLHGINYIDPEQHLVVGFRDCKPDEFWVRGHIPGRPIFPGVLMIESAAQLISYYAGKVVSSDKFLGFGGVDEVKFRGAVSPGDRVTFVGKITDVRPGRRCMGVVQSYVRDQLVFEGTITGMYL